MQIYWSLRHVPELAPLPPADRKRVHRAAFREYVRRAPADRWTVLAYVLLLILLPATFATFGLFAGFDGLPELWTAAVSATVGFLIGTFLLSRILIPHLRHRYADHIEPLDRCSPAPSPKGRKCCKSNKNTMNVAS